MESSDSECCTPPEIRKEAEEMSSDLLPKKSKNTYEDAYKKFVQWKESNNAITSENCLKVYFKDLIKNYKPSTIWSIYSKLKSTIQINKKISIHNYKELSALLSQNSRGYKSKKAKVFSTAEINLFLETAPDEMYLAAKVVLIFGLSGCCRKQEIYSIKMGDIKKQGELLEVIIPDTKNNVPRRFVVDPKFVPVIEKYIALRPLNVPRENFFLQYHNGKCSVQVIGINTVGKIPKLIAQFLKLENAGEYTGHSFRRTSATIYADTGVSTMDLQRLGGWKSAGVAQGYVEDSTEYKKQTAKRISNAIIGGQNDNNSENTAPSKKLRISNSENFNLGVNNPSPGKIVIENCTNVTITYNK
ncbi:uncharacterized protein LOC122509710 [Leptopilina heterotoma]|uniref:uncharacterized protein LOC122509710 n=1 Tax=Leptopilina heterotoma TaxID=63436 RepID=UPI001CA971EF|nr:uncharacterized protein LOC122509710 [Leptopilina heterotoma]